MNKIKKQIIITIKGVKPIGRKILVKFPFFYSQWEIIKRTIKNTWEKRYLYKYPLFISYPRSGSHWINSIMELYFDRPRVKHGEDTYLGKYRDDWMWVHDHDLDLYILKNILRKNKFGKILFLHRNPLDVVYSDIKMRMGSPKTYGAEYLTKQIAFGDKNVKKNFLHWIEHHKAYMSNLNSKNFTFIKYENFLQKDKQNIEFKKVCKHFSVNFEEKKFEKIFQKFGKIKIAKYRSYLRKEV